MGRNINRRMSGLLLRRVWHIDKVNETETKYLKENQHKRSLERDAPALATLDPYIGELPLQRVHHDTLQPFVRARLVKGISPGTINRDLAVVRRILNVSARLWRDASDRTWLETPPLIQMQRHPNKRLPYPLSIDEERLLFSELEAHLARMALFKVNTGLREQEVVNIRWAWETKVPELEDTSVDPSGYTTLSTRMVTDCEPRAWASRIASSSSATNQITSPCTTRHPNSES